MRRFLKQFIYGTFYLAILAAIGYGVYFAAISFSPSCFDNRLNQGEAGIDCGGPCLDCAIKNLKPLRESVELFGINGSTNAVITFVNSNIDYGAESFVYTLTFRGPSGESLLSVDRESFIYPAEARKIVVEPNLRLNILDISGPPELSIKDVAWESVGEFSEPKTQIRQVRTELAGNRATVTGLLANRESFRLTKATVDAVIYQLLDGGNTRLAGVSKTILQDIQPFEERSFKIIVPLTEPLGLSELDVITTAEVQQ